MTLADLYRVATVGQKIIVKDCKKDWNVVYNGEIDNISFSILDRKIRWIGSSDIYVGTLKIIIE